MINHPNRAPHWTIIQGAYEASRAVCVERARNGRQRLVVRHCAGDQWLLRRIYRPTSRAEALALAHSHAPHADGLALELVADAAARVGRFAA